VKFAGHRPNAPGAAGRRAPSRSPTRIERFTVQRSAALPTKKIAGKLFGTKAHAQAAELGHSRPDRQDPWMKLEKKLKFFRRAWTSPSKFNHSTAYATSDFFAKKKIGSNGAFTIRTALSRARSRLCSPVPKPVLSRSKPRPGQGTVYNAVQLGFRRPKETAPSPKAVHRPQSKSKMAWPVERIREFSEFLQGKLNRRQSSDPGRVSPLAILWMRIGITKGRGF